jgi:hypothetical protein
MMKRRTALKIVALGSLAPAIEAFAAGLPCSMEPGTAWSVGTYQRRFFTAPESDLLDQLMEMIIPADAHSPGARAAHVNSFADLMVSLDDDATKARWRSGLKLIQDQAEQSSVADALAVAAAHEDHPTSDLDRFFGEVKRMTIDGYYTSEIGIQQDLQYQGNTYLSEFPGCTHPEHS